MLTSQNVPLGLQGPLWAALTLRLFQTSPFQEMPHHSQMVLSLGMLWTALPRQLTAAKLSLQLLVRYPCWNVFAVALTSDAVQDLLAEKPWETLSADLLLTVPLAQVPAGRQACSVQHQ